jgi:hypothetical protein
MICEIRTIADLILSRPSQPISLRTTALDGQAYKPAPDYFPGTSIKSTPGFGIPDGGFSGIEV